MEVCWGQKKEALEIQEKKVERESKQKEEKNSNELICGSV